MIYILAAFIAFSLSWLTNRYLSSGRSWVLTPDEPNHRSLHSIATPRGGGVGILLGVLTGCALSLQAEGVYLPGGLAATVGLLLVTAVSFWDDRQDWSPRLRLFLQAGAAILVILTVGEISRVGLPGIGAVYLAWLSAPFTFLFIIWMMNLYNFMDGIDGFAGGMGTFGFAALALIGWMEGEPLFASFSLIISAANLGFLSVNFPPAKIFMGDVGSVPMGYLVAVMTIWGTQSDIFEFWVPVLIFAPFIVDATLTLAQRAMRRERFWVAHNSHYYQRLVKFGWGHRRVVIAEYILMLACAAAAILMHNAQSDSFKATGLVAILIGWIILARLIDEKAPMQRVDSDKAGT